MFGDPDALQVAAARDWLLSEIELATLTIEVMKIVLAHVGSC